MWGTALIVAGLMVALLAIKKGVTKFRQQVINVVPQDRVGRWFDLIMFWLVPAQGVLLIVFWMIQSVLAEGESWLDPFGMETLMTLLWQWFLAGVIAWLLQVWMNRREKRQIVVAHPDAIEDSAAVQNTVDDPDVDDDLDIDYQATDMHGRAGRIAEDEDLEEEEEHSEQSERRRRTTRV